MMKPTRQIQKIIAVLVLSGAIFNTRKGYQYAFADDPPKGDEALTKAAIDGLSGVVAANVALSVAYLRSHSDKEFKDLLPSVSAAIERVNVKDRPASLFFLVVELSKLDAVSRYVAIAAVSSKLSRADLDSFQGLLMCKILDVAGIPNSAYGVHPVGVNGLPPEYDAGLRTEDSAHEYQLPSWSLGLLSTAGDDRDGWIKCFLYLSNIAAHAGSDNEAFFNLFGGTSPRGISHFGVLNVDQPFVLSPQEKLAIKLKLDTDEQIAGLVADSRTQASLAHQNAERLDVVETQLKMENEKVDEALTVATAAVSRSDEFIRDLGQVKTQLAGKFSKAEGDELKLAIHDLEVEMLIRPPNPASPAPQAPPATPQHGQSAGVQLIGNQETDAWGHQVSMFYLTNKDSAHSVRVTVAWRYQYGFNNPQDFSQTYDLAAGERKMVRSSNPLTEQLSGQVTGVELK